MSAFAKSIQHAGKVCLGYADAVLAGIEPAQFARLAHVAGETIHSNHPAFVFGHLSIYPARMLSMLGRDPSPCANPEGFEEIFSAQAECRDDPNGTIYPDHEIIVSHFKHAYANVLPVLGELTDKELEAPNPVQPMAARLPTIGLAAMFLVGPHIMVHLGQVSAWRRMMGLGSAM